MYRFGEKIWFDNQLLLSADIFKEMKECNVKFKELEQFKEDYIKFRNSFFIGSPINREIYLQRKGMKFAFAIYDNEFYLWHEGHNSLGQREVDINSTPDEKFIKWIDEKINNRINGKINCSDCGKILDEKEVAGRYFAGLYCKDCWERTWKEIEAKENYD